MLLKIWGWILGGALTAGGAVLQVPNEGDAWEGIIVLGLLTLLFTAIQEATDYSNAHPSEEKKKSEEEKK